MNESTDVVSMDRSDDVDYVSSELLPRVACLTRLIGKQLGGGYSRAEIGVLNTLSGGPRRITELAELEGVAQPTMTILIQELESRGLVRRERHADDGRVVMVHLTDLGDRKLGDARAQASAALRPYVAQMSNEQLDALATTTETLQALIILLQRRTIG